MQVTDASEGESFCAKDGGEKDKNEVETAASLAAFWRNTRRLVFSPVADITIELPLLMLEVGCNRKPASDAKSNREGTTGANRCPLIGPR